MIIQPYTHTTSDLEANSTNFPCCKLFFKMDEGSGNSITDSISGNSIATGLTLGWGTANAITVSAGASASNLSLGKTITVGALSALRLTVCNLGTLSSHSIGISGSNRFIMLSSGASVSDGTNSALPAVTPTTGEIIGLATNFVSGTTNEGTVRQATLTTLTGPTSANATPGDLTNIGNITHITALSATVGNYVCYGDALFVFANGLPADTSAAVTWMTAQWQAGNKEIYPGWKGLA